MAKQTKRGNAYGFINRFKGLFGTDEDELKNIKENEYYGKEPSDVPYTYNKDPAALTKQLVADDRSRLFGFGPRLGTNNAARLNTQIGIERGLGDEAVARALREAQGLSGIDIEGKRQLGEIEIEQGPAIVAAKRGFKLDDIYPSTLATQLGLDEASQAASGLASTRDRGARLTYKNVFPFANREAIDKSRSGANRAAVESDYTSSQEGKQLRREALGAQDTLPGMLASKAGRIELGSGDAVFSPSMPDLLKGYGEKGLYYNPPPEQFYQSQNIGGQTFLAPRPSTRAGSPGFLPSMTGANVSSLGGGAAGIGQVAPQISTTPTRAAGIMGQLASPSGQPLNTQLQGVTQQALPPVPANAFVGPRDTNSAFGLWEIIRKILGEQGDAGKELNEAADTDRKSDTLQKKYEEKKKKKAESAK